MTWILGYLLIGSLFSAVAYSRKTEVDKIPTWAFWVTVIVWPYTSFLVFKGKFK